MHRKQFKKQIRSIPQIWGWRKTNTEVQLLVAGWPHWQEATSGGGCPWSKSSSSPPFGAQLYSAIAPEFGSTTVWCSNLYSLALQPLEYCCHLVLLFQYVEIQHRPAQWLMVLPKHHLVFFYKSIQRINQKLICSNFHKKFFFVTTKKLHCNVFSHFYIHTVHHV